MHLMMTCVNQVSFQLQTVISQIYLEERSKTKWLISTCIGKLKTLQCHVYNLKDEKFLQHLILQIDNLKEAVYLQVPKEAGLTVLDSNANTHLEEVSKDEID